MHLHNHNYDHSPTDWKDSQFSDYWPGWDTRLKETGQDITNLSQ